MTRAGFASLRVRLLLLVLLAVVPALGLLVYTSAHHRRLLVMGVEDELLRWTRLAVVDYAQLLDRAEQLLATLAKLPDLPGQDPAACQAFLARVLKDYPFYANLGVVGPDGDARCRATPLPGRDDVAQRLDLARLDQLRSFTVGAYGIDPVAGKATLIAAYPVTDAAGLAGGAVFAEIDMGWFRALASSSELPSGTVLMVLDGQGRILARYPGSEPWVGRAVQDTPIAQAVLARGAGVARAADIDGSRKVFAFTLLEHAGAPTAYVVVGLSPSVIFAKANEIFAQGVVWFGLASLLALAGAWIGGDVFVLRRVRMLVNATKRLAAGDLAARTGVRDGRGELDHLARAFDEMAAELQRRHAQVLKAAEALRKAHEELEIRVQERTADLRMANKRLEELSRLKDEVVSIVSHELRNPLAAARGALDLVLDAALGPVNEEQREYLEIIRSNMTGLTELTTTILDVSKIESGRLSLVRQRVHVTQLIEAALKTYKGLAGQRTLAADVAPAPAVFADPNRMLQVLVNLLSNAVKFTPPDGTIRIGVRAQDGMVAISVQDDGVGIAPDDLPKLFQKFAQVGEREAKRKGTGLGLMLCKQLVELHRGTITVESELGHGTRFTVTLPAYAAPFVLQESVQELLESAKRTRQDAVAVVALDGRALVERLAAQSTAMPEEPLERVAQALRKCLLQDEIVLGLDPHWLAVLSITDAKDAHVVQRRLRIAVDGLFAAPLKTPGGAPAAMGLVVYPTDGTDPHALFLRAVGAIARLEPLPKT